MGKLKLKHENLYKALQRLEEAVTYFDKFQTEISGEYDVHMYRTLRDSMINFFDLSSPVEITNSIIGVFTSFPIIMSVLSFGITT